QMRRNAEHFSGALGADQGMLRAAEEMVGVNLKVAKQVRVRGTITAGRHSERHVWTISSVVVVAIAFLIMFFVIRLT
ncbi:hypothetical protein EDB89DRAFT_1852957, partial [Lactarius sanguifluus]